MTLVNGRQNCHSVGSTYILTQSSSCDNIQLVTAPFHFSDTVNVWTWSTRSTDWKTQASFLATSFFGSQAIGLFFFFVVLRETKRAAKEWICRMNWMNGSLQQLQMSQGVWHEVYCRWDVCRATNGSQPKCSAPNKFYTCVQRNYFELTITSEVSASTYLFLFQSYSCWGSGHSFARHCTALLSIFKI